MDLLEGFAATFFLLAQQMGIYLLLGFGVAGLLKVFVPDRWVYRQLGESSAAAVLKGALLGAPLPLCSCGVIPVAASLKKSGASPASVLSFLIATPVTGVDSILATFALMGTFLAVVRPLAGVLIAIVAGLALLVALRHPRKRGPEESLEANGWPGWTRLPARLLAAALYGFGELVAGVARPVLVGLLLGAAISYFLPEHFIHHTVGRGFLSYLAVVAVATPLYVCATGSIPIAAALMLKGLSPGAALDFLIAGPATNTVTITVARDLVGKRGLVVYLATIMLGSLGVAWGTDLLVTALDLAPGEALSAHSHGETMSWLQTVAGLVLLALVSWHAVVPRLPRPAAGRREEG